MRSCIGPLALMLTVSIVGCSKQPTEAEIGKCKTYDESILVQAVVSHLRATGQGDATASSVRVTGQPIFQSSDGSWLVPVDIDATKHYYAMIDCAKHVEFSVRK